ncbi:MarR family winged helix-turn-helix transcriptional regulator [Microbacterium testaceum]|uniref:MarR family winged helix-turn-helix transcriptional regulator n=1 Tax=Microbacterium testaceum TaxID=2033 RepID=UPI0012AC9212|nr:hypothetical protein [Microbacterium testaceum]
MNTSTPLDPRSLAHRLTTVGHALHHRLFAQLRDSDLHPKTVFLLRAIDGRIDAPWVAERLARGGKRVSALADRGWIISTDDGWALTDEGRAVLDRLDADRSALLADVPADDLERLVAALDTIEGALGLDAESGDDRGPRGFGPGFGPRGGFGPAFGPGFGPRGGFGPFGPGMRRGFDPDARGFDRDADGEGRRGHGGPRAHDGDAEHARGERGPRYGYGFGPDFGHGHGRGHGERGYGFGPGFGHGHGRGHGERGHGFGPDFGHGHGRGRGERGHGFGPGFGHGRGHGDGERGHGRGHRAAQRAYERGFDAGFSRGRESTASGTPSDSGRGPVAE